MNRRAHRSLALILSSVLLWNALSPPIALAFRLDPDSRLGECEYVRVGEPSPRGDLFYGVDPLGRTYRCAILTKPEAARDDRATNTPGAGA